MGAPMAEFIKTQHSFAYGEVAPEFFARDNINGLSKLENMDVMAGGGLTRRQGLTPVATLTGRARLVPFSVSETENYLLVLTQQRLAVMQNGVKKQELLSPWSLDDLANLQYAQRFGTMIFVHPDHQPRRLQKNGTTFELAPFAFAVNNSDLSVNMPFMSFDDADGIKITLSSSSLGGNFSTLTTDKAFWTSENVGGLLQFMDKQWLIHQYISSTQVVAYVNGGYVMPSAPITDWREAAFSARRGWPCSISFHQDRLVFGGSKSWPSGVWMSQVGRHNNFNVGTGLDDEAIFITLLSQQRQQICTVVSSDNLQILTSAGEWAISSKPLTPSVVDIKQHTSVGSVATRYLPPQKIEGTTVFISGSKKDIRELSLDELGEHYNATDLCAFAKHLMTDPIDIAYNEQTKQLFVVMESGDMAVLNQNSALGISAWASYKTQGDFQSVAVVDGETFVTVLRDGAVKLEKFSPTAMIDGNTYGFAFSAAAMPLRASGHNASRLRIRKISARLLDTKSIFINNRRVTLPNSIYSSDAPGYSGDVSMNFLGSQRECINAPWVLHGNEPLPATILSVTIYGNYKV